jgi:hypothetical protein
MPKTNIERIEEWIKTLLTDLNNAGELGKQLCLDSRTIGHCFKWIHGIRKTGPRKGTAQIWEVWKEGS